MIAQDKLRNIAIIAHVDHGKTTLVDGLLKQAKTFAEHQAEMSQTTIMDHNDLERERGVTILAKNTAVFWNDFKINIIDTPGHADFSGEVERVLNMAEGCILLVDSSEGVLSQTKFVLSLALKLGLKVMVLINKVDRKDQRVDEVLEEINDLFLELATDDSQLDFPVFYAIGRDGIAGKEIKTNEDNSLTVIDSKDFLPLFNGIVDFVPAPTGDRSAPARIQVTNIDFDEYKGTYGIGKIDRGVIKKGQQLTLVRGDEGKKIETTKVEYLFEFKGLTKSETDEVGAGDVVAIAGFSEVKISDTLCDPAHLEPMPHIEISEPTIQVQFLVSTSPLVGKDGQFNTSRQIKARLDKELERNVGLRVGPGTSGESFLVSGRGELHIAVLIEEMRREGFEFSVGRPEVIYKEEDGEKTEPWELLTIEVPEEFVGIVTSEMGERKAIFKNMKNIRSGVRFDYEISSKNLIGFRSNFQAQTSGQGVVNSLVLGYRPVGEEMQWQRNGVLISAVTGTALAHDLARLEDRGQAFVGPGTELYTGMIIGENAKREDIVMNVCKGKKMTNVRSSADVLVRLSPPKIMSLEQALTYLAHDELLEVTPKNLRLRKRDLSPGANYS
ncbi:MAG: translational GTPase TypA [Pseudomonadales bacterium]|jgi:GTP-binding protein|nr:translational GTPase TypA [Pseudomonadales bacterium]